ncbi:MAG TPA: alpha/beta hydrolase [Burkholderiaceae bacterium]|nr:alpha/beta hydrolase [Burkholderiaceae bacterium]
MKAPPPQPFYFGPPGEGLFAWLHRPATGDCGLGLVICNPFGFEEVCAHRSLRHIAIGAAEAGVPSLRFDYAGCGNSEGDEFEPQRFAHWLGSVHRAVDALKQASGVTQVCLLGVRLGASLATLAALERDDVAALIAIAPVVRGRAYLRELTILGEAGAKALPERRGQEGLLESAGFVLTAETSASLGEMDLRMLPRAPAPRVVIVERDDMPAAANWAPELERLGAQVKVVAWPGYAAMMRDPQRSQVPRQIVEGVLACLAEWRGAAAAPAATAARVPGSEALVRGRLRETAVHVTTGVSPLFGVLTREEGEGAQPAVLMLNSGSVHHIGPNRLWVRLARDWAGRGVTVLRLDISGIADSPPQPGAEENVVYSRQAASDVAAALAYLRSLGATECHAMGLCSGGYHALKAAMAGQDIASATMVNPLTFYWKEGTQMSDLKDYEVSGLAAKFRSKLFTTTSWKKLLRGKVDVRIVAQVAWRRLWSFVYPHALELARVLHLPLRNDLARDLGSTARKGVRLQFIFAENAPGFELLEKQGGQAIHRLVARRQATLDFVPGADHTFTRIDAREQLVALLNARVRDELVRPAARA